MNHFIENNAYTIIALLVCLIIFLMGTMIYILYKLLLNHRYGATREILPSNTLPASTKEIPTLKRHEKVIEKFQCHNHPDESSVGSCLICEDVFCENCLVEHESMHFCKDHFRVFANNKWKQITDVRTTPETPEEGLFIYNFKKDMWLKSNTPAYVMTHYKINIENDFIESFIQLHVREEDAENLSEELQKYKALD